MDSSVPRFFSARGGVGVLYGNTPVLSIWWMVNRGEVVVFSWWIVVLKCYFFTV
jgi:hypothetical protein